jgi:AraC-like DNA-binding protein
VLLPASAATWRQLLVASSWEGAAKRLGTRPTRHVRLAQPCPCLLDGEEPALEAILHDLVELRSVEVRRDVDHRAQRRGDGGAARRSVVGVTPQELADLAHLRRARDLMDRAYAEPLDVPAMARAALMSPAHFSRKFRAAYGETPYSYLMTRRIERAQALLRQGMSVTDTCVAVGCTSLGSFSSRFTEIVGETPSQYRSRDHSELEVVPSCVSMIATRPRRSRATA